MQDRFKFRFFNKIANKMVLPINYANVDCIYEFLAFYVGLCETYIDEGDK